MVRSRRAILLLTFLLLHSFPSTVLSSPSTSSASCPFSAATDRETHSHGHAHDHDDGHAPDHGHGHSHAHGCNHDHDSSHVHSHLDPSHHRHHDSSPSETSYISKRSLPEELAEEEELRLFGFKSESHIDNAHHRHHDRHNHHQQSAASSVGLWMRALGCSLLVSMASLICLILLPLIVTHGKPSRTVVDFLAAFGAGAMLGDAFLHQLPHALGGSHLHVHVPGSDHSHGHHEGMGHTHDGAQGHSHSIQDLSVGLASLAGIILFFLVEKIVRQVELASSKGNIPWAHHHGHHHHPHRQGDHDDYELTKQHLNAVNEKMDDKKPPSDSKRIEDTSETSANGSPKHDRSSTDKPYRHKKTDVQQELDALNSLSEKDKLNEKASLALSEQTVTPNLILGYLNLFSDGVHNFTDGMALGAAFLNHGAIGGWSRTMFLLAHELPQEVGDFGILVQSGFSVVKALAFNFLSALVALAGTTVALVLGGDPGHSSLIEGFTAGGFIYIAVAGVLPEMHQHGTSIKATFLQLMALSLGMGVALTISLME